MNGRGRSQGREGGLQDFRSPKEIPQFKKTVIPKFEQREILQLMPRLTFRLGEVPENIAGTDPSWRSTSMVTFSEVFSLFTASANYVVSMKHVNSEKL